jgi:hypothetical protein
MRDELQALKAKVLSPDFQFVSHSLSKTGTNRLKAFLSECIPGDIVPNDVIEELTGEKLGYGGKAESALSLARRFCTRHKDVVFGRPRGSGYIVCLDSVGKIGEAKRMQGRSRRVLNGSLNVVSAIKDYDSLTDSQRAEVTAVRLTSVFARKALLSSKVQNLSQIVEKKESPNLFFDKISRDMS